MATVRSWRESKRNIAVAASTAGAMMVVGLALIAALAAGSSVAFEAEQEGAPLGNANVISDMSASGGEALQFGSGDSEVPAPPSGEPPLWVGDFETGDTSQFNGPHVNEAIAPTIVTDPVREGKYAVRMEIPGNPSDNGGYGARTELLPDIPRQYEGDDLYFGWSLMLAPDFPTQASWQVITQWHAGVDGTPPITLGAEEGEFQLEGGGSNGTQGYSISLGPAVTGEWVDWVFHIKFAHGSAGSIEVWRNGEHVLPPYTPSFGTMYSDGETYPKFGYYRSFAIQEPGTIYFDSWRVGTSRGSVTPR